MEVHSHSHSHGKKNWKSYIWEFLMLFLAVFCGFMAEYQLEHKIENDREIVYIKSMVDDLNQDIKKIDSSIFFFKSKEKNFDTIYRLFPTIKNGYNHSLRSNLKGIVGYKDFFPTDKTMQQLKNSGNMRLIKNKISLDGITNYDLKLREYEKTLKDLNDMLFKFIDASIEIEDNCKLNLDLKTKSIAQIEKANNNYLLTNDDAKLGAYYNRIMFYQKLRNQVVMRMHTIKQDAIELTKILKTEYDF